ncbi:hypothetical protein DMC47_04905 [Nostoc sp. 3335mG]|nr:hypothetical protein DMC47_04905 [Nostoc sp. 3335mG]
MDPLTSSSIVRSDALLTRHAEERCRTIACCATSEAAIARSQALLRETAPGVTGFIAQPGVRRPPTGA